DADVELLLVLQDPVEAVGDGVAVGRPRLARPGHAADADDPGAGGHAEVGVAGGRDAGHVRAVAVRVARVAHVLVDVGVAGVPAGHRVVVVGEVRSQLRVLRVHAGVDDGDADPPAVDVLEGRVGPQGGETDGVEGAVEPAEGGAVFQQ